MTARTLVRPLAPERQAFVDILTSRVESMIGPQLPGTFELVNFEQGFAPTPGVPGGDGFDAALIDAFDGTLEVGSDGMLELVPGRFSALYGEILDEASWRFSPADQEVIQDREVKARQQAVERAACESGFVEAHGLAFPTYPAILAAILRGYGNGPQDWSYSSVFLAAANLAEVGFARLGGTLLGGLATLAPLNAVLGARAEVCERRASALAHLRHPCSRSAGLRATDGGHRPGWASALSPEQIRAGLRSPFAARVDFALSGFDRGAARLKVSASGGFGVRASEALGVHLPNGQLEWSAGISARTKVDVSVTYPGLTIARVDPAALSGDLRRGWYDPGLLREIVRASDDPTVSGLGVDRASPCAPGRAIGRGRALSRLGTIVLSRAPTVTMRFSRAPWGEVLQRLAPGTEARLDLLGILDIGARPGSYGVSSVERAGDAGEVTVTFAPTPAPAAVGDGPAAELHGATVLGGVPCYPR
jgi:hypothetical protein